MFLYYDIGSICDQYNIILYYIMTKMQRVLKIELQTTKINNIKIKIIIEFR